MNMEHNFVEFEFDKNNYNMQKESDVWKMSLKRSEVQIQSDRDLAILCVENQFLLPCEAELQEDALHFNYKLEGEYLTFQELGLKERTDKLRAMINMARIKEVLSMPVTYFIHPENILFDRNLMPKIAYRGLRDRMTPPIDETILLRQYKCLIIALFQDKSTFSKLYDGNLEIVNGNSFITEVNRKTSFEELSQYLIVLYEELMENNAKKLRLVSKTRYRVFQQLSIWFAVLVLIISVPLGYYVFIRDPFQTRMLESDNAFLKNDYETVIRTLQNVDTGNIPYTQKYELAYSFVQGNDLTDDQKRTIMNNISLRSDENYMDYWIENGRGNLDEALDIGKKLEDSDLILYGLMQKIEQVRHDTSLTGTQREEQIESLESEYKKYEEKRDGMLSDPETSDTAEIEESDISETTDLTDYNDSISTTGSSEGE